MQIHSVSYDTGAKKRKKSPGTINMGGQIQNGNDVMAEDLSSFTSCLAK
jgi:hypothetical protein